MIEAKNGSSANGATSSDLLCVNKWDNVDDFIAVLNKIRTEEWQWYKNSRCKYVELRVDMRDGGCIIKDRHGARITPAELAKQIDT